MTEVLIVDRFIIHSSDTSDTSLQISTLQNSKLLILNFWPDFQKSLRHIKECVKNFIS